MRGGFGVTGRPTFGIEAPRISFGSDAMPFHPLLPANAGTQAFYRRDLILLEKAWTPGFAGESGA